MALVPEERDGVSFMTGVTKGGGELRMGRQLFSVGAHWVGFDDNFTEPVIVTAIFDPTKENRPRGVTRFIGYMQFIQVTFNGQPIPPQVYGGRLADRAPYVTDREHGHTFVDFMGPADANIRRPKNAKVNPYHPFYAVNATLEDGSVQSERSLALHPQINGSLYYPGLTDRGGRVSVGASLVAEVTTELKTEGIIERWLTQESLVARIEPSAEQQRDFEPYAIALDYLRSRGDLRGVQDADLAGEVVGGYVLLTLPDDEHRSPVLCISTASEGDTPVILAHLIASDDLESIEEDAGLDALDRIAAFLRDQDLYLIESMDISDRVAERGQGGLRTLPFRFTPGEFCLELKYSTIAVIQRQRALRGTELEQLTPLSGFSWSLLFEFDEDTRRLFPSAIRAPYALGAYDLVTPLRKFDAALNDPHLKDQKIDTSNFTRAAMRRSNLGSGAKFQFVS